MIRAFDNHIRIAKKYRSRDGSTKYLMTLNDQTHIEAVCIPQGKDDVKLCISSQVGCSNKCAYCATGIKEYVRDMNAQEIVGQIACILENNNLNVEDKSKPGILFMGMGEPFFNYDSVLKAIEILASERDFVIPLEKIIVSTSGVIPKILDFASTEYRTRLAVSINACENTLRDKLMPINKVYPLEKLLKACEEYQETTDARIIFEYVIIRSVNDAQAHMYRLANLVKNFNCEVHLIPFNESKHIQFSRPEQTVVKQFCDTLRESGIFVSVKPSYAIDVYGGCGQLKGLQK